MNVKIFYGGLSGFREILSSSSNYMSIVDLAILDDSRNRKVKVDVQGNRGKEKEEILHFDDVVAFSDDYPSLTEGTIESFTNLVLRYDIDNLYLQNPPSSPASPPSRRRGLKFFYSRMAHGKYRRPLRGGVD